MSFEWGNGYKLEEWFEREIDQSVIEYVCDFYKVGRVEDLTESQIDEIGKFIKKNQNLTLLSVGLNNVISKWIDRDSFEEEEE